MGQVGTGCRSQKKVVCPILSARLCVCPWDLVSGRSQSGQLLWWKPVTKDSPSLLTPTPSVPSTAFFIQSKAGWLEASAEPSPN